MDIAAYRILYDSIYDFKNAANTVEMKIRELKINHDIGDQDVPETHGRKHRDMWASMKNVSHFNLGISLELMLKFLLHLNNKSEKAHGHNLSALYKELPPKYQVQLEDLYKKIHESSHAFELIAYLNTESPTLESSEVPIPSICTVEKFWEYFDQNLIWWEKRYVYEYIEKKRWRHYLTDIHVPVELIRHVMRDIPPYPEVSC